MRCMDKIPNFIDEVKDLLWAGNAGLARSRKQEAEEFLEKVINEAQAQIDGLHDLMPSSKLGQLLAKSNGKSRVDLAAKLSRLQPSKEERREIVVKTAKQCAEKDGKVTVNAVAEALDQVDYDLCVSANRVTTSIGNMLNKHPDFEYVKRGVYKYKGGQLPFQH